MLGPSEDAGRGLLRTCLKSDGRGQRFLKALGHNRSNLPTEENLRAKRYAAQMDGREVYRNAVTSMTAAMNQVLEAEGITIDDLDEAKAFLLTVREAVMKDSTQDPLVEIKKEELNLRMTEQERKGKEAEEKLDLEKKKAKDRKTTDKERIEQQKDALAIRSAIGAEKLVPSTKDHL